MDPIALALTLAAPLVIWSQPLRLTVSGTGCNATLTMASAPVSGFVDVTVHDACAAGHDPAPFTVTGTLRDLPPGTYTVRATDSFARVATQPLEVDMAANAVLELPDVARSDDPAPFRVSFPGGGCDGTPAQVHGNRIDVERTECPVLPTVGPTTRPIPVGPLAPGTYQIYFRDETAFVPSIRTGTLHVRDAQRCFPADDRLCLQDGRFAITGTWRAFDGTTGIAHASPLAGDEVSGLLWFFAPDNAEITAKLLEGCGLNDHWWAFLSSASSVEYALTVTDTVTGAAKVYTNASGHLPALVADVEMEECR